ncbi:YybH family protein [Marinicella meishanensis]|uniref:YybH family protein n=1 Tax=Marinicella meishanensis TaxID=2873263 RepID=UPI001CBDB000|nr:nuclear transport factor 2 family protein [Marinicella sp. NBU2979]
MKTNRSIWPWLWLLVSGWLAGCQPHKPAPAGVVEEAARRVLTTHLNAVSNKDLDTLAATLSTAGGMQLILPGQEIIHGVDGFMAFHENWFAQPNWTFETEILQLTVGTELAYAVVQIIYREPERDGQPYFNRMIVSYDLQRLAGQWYVVKDHASSVKKSTD